MVRLNNLLKKSILKYGLPILTSGIIFSGCNNSDSIKYGCQEPFNCEDGYGIYYYKDGSVYKGYFRDGKREGGGILTFPNGVKIKGDFHNNKFPDPEID